jgi:hypothetical protein
MIHLKRSGVPIKTVKIFYMACIRPIMTYACPSWFSMITKEQQMRLQRVEGIALKVMDPNGASYFKRTRDMQIEPILTVLNNTSKEYIVSISNNVEHCLHSLIKLYSHKATGRAARTSATLHQPAPKARTKLRLRCLLLYYQHN